MNGQKMIFTSTKKDIEAKTSSLQTGTGTTVYMYQVSKDAKASRRTSS
jgi:hypothetical protein